MEAIITNTCIYDEHCPYPITNRTSLLDNHTQPTVNNRVAVYGKITPPLPAPAQPHHSLFHAKSHAHASPEQEYIPFTKQTQHKRQTVHLTLWVKPVVKEELERIAASEGISVSKAGGSFLEQSLQSHIDMHYSALLQPIIENAIQKQMRSYSTRLAVLFVGVLLPVSKPEVLSPTF